ncbi:MAG: SDR family NAD(P)-dependent oxidoreductase [Oscillospiraceae bacterium]
MNVALVTGSSRGIGAACAAALARSGYKVCINCIERMDLAEKLAALLRSEGHKAICHQADVAEHAAANEMVRYIEADFGPVDLLVNNAGIAITPAVPGHKA